MKKENVVAHLALLVRPFIMGGLVAALWYFAFYKFGWHIRESDESAFTDSGVPVLAMFHAIIAGSTLVQVWDEYKIIRRCIRNNDRETFRQCMHDRIPLAIHTLLGAMSFLTVMLTLVLHFEGPMAGLLLNFAVAFVIALFWEVATNLDDPVNGVWYKRSIPSDWLE